MSDITFDGPDGLRYDPRVHEFIEPDGTLASDERVTAAWDKHDAAEPISDLMSEREYHERRRLFIRAMRHPEMRILRAALADLKWDKGIDWRTITRLDIDPPSPPYGSTWTCTTDQHLIVCYWPDDARLDFDLYQLHDADNPACDCLFCS